MLKKKTSKPQKISFINMSNSLKPKKIKASSDLKAYDPTKALLDEDRIGRAIWECLKNEDTEGVIEVISIHLEAKNKAQLMEEIEIPKTTFYHSLRSKNPTLKTLAKLVHACA
jgi:DNA-binding phage protein